MSRDVSEARPEQRPPSYFGGMIAIIHRWEDGEIARRLTIGLRGRGLAIRGVVDAQNPPEGWLEDDPEEPILAVVLWSFRSVSCEQTLALTTWVRAHGQIIGASVDGSQRPSNAIADPQVDLSVWDGRGEAAVVQELKDLLEPEVPAVSAETTDGTIESDRFDVFLSHASEDKGEVRVFAERLREAGIRPWLDEEQMVVGVNPQSAVASGIRASHHILLWVTSHWLDKEWTHWELELVHKQRTDQGKRVIPVLFVPWSDEHFGPYLTRHTAIDVTDGDERLWLVYCGLFEEPPGPRRKWADCGRSLAWAGQSPMPRGRWAVGDWSLDAEPLGRGGYGGVYRGVREDGEVAAIKVYTPRAGAEADRQGRRRFRQGPQALRRLEARGGHPNIVGLIEGPHEEGKTLWYAMDLVEGESLFEGIAEVVTWSVEERLRFFFGILDAIVFAHDPEDPVYHRDLSPRNILIDKRTEPWSPVVVDFDLARAHGFDSLTRTQSLAGTQHYVPPEQIERWHAGGSYTWERPEEELRDLWALGMLLYFMLTRSENPDAGRRRVKLHARLAEDAPAGMAKALEEALLKALSPSPADRPESARQFRLQLQQALVVSDAARFQDSLQVRVAERLFTRAMRLALTRADDSSDRAFAEVRRRFESNRDPEIRDFVVCAKWYQNEVNDSGPTASATTQLLQVVGNTRQPVLQEFVAFSIATTAEYYAGREDLEAADQQVDMLTGRFGSHPSASIQRLLHALGDAQQEGWGSYIRQPSTAAPTPPPPLPAPPLPDLTWTQYLRALLSPSGWLEVAAVAVLAAGSVGVVRWVSRENVVFLLGVPLAFVLGWVVFVRRGIRSTGLPLRVGDALRAAIWASATSVGWFWVAGLLIAVPVMVVVILGEVHPSQFRAPVLVVFTTSAIVAIAGPAVVALRDFRSLSNLARRQAVVGVRLLWLGCAVVFATVVAVGDTLQPGPVVEDPLRPERLSGELEERLTAAKPQVQEAVEAFVAARNEVRRLAERDPAAVGALVRHGWHQGMSGQWEEADQAYAAVLAMPAERVDAKWEVRAHIGAAQIAVLRGDLNRAETHLIAAERLIDAQTEIPADDRVWVLLKNDALSHGYNVQHGKGHRPMARAVAEAQVALMRDLASDTSAEVLAGQVDAHLNYGWALYFVDEPESAQAAFDLAERFAQTLVQNHPNDLRGWWLRTVVAEGRGWNLLAQEDTRDQAVEAIAEFWQRIHHLASADPNNDRFRSRLVGAHGLRSRALSSRGDSLAARKEDDRAAALAAEVAAAHPSFGSLQSTAASYEHIIASRKRMLHALHSAQEHIVRSERRLRRFVEAHPEHLKWAADLYDVRSLARDVGAAIGNLPAARDFAQGQLAMAEHLAGAHPVHPEKWERRVPVSQEALGDIHKELGDVSNAKSAYQAALNDRRTFLQAEPDDAALRVDMAELCWKLAELDPATSRPHLQEGLALLGQAAANRKLDNRRTALVQAIRSKLASLPLRTP